MNNIHTRVSLKTHLTIADSSLNSRSNLYQDSKTIATYKIKEHHSNNLTIISNPDEPHTKPYFFIVLFMHSYRPTLS